MEFLKNPNLPDKRVKSVIIDCRADDETLENLQKLGIEPVLSYKSEKLHPSVCSHPDMTILHLGNNKFICSPDSYDYYKSALPKAEIIKGAAALLPEYPHDILYNITLLDKFTFMNTSTSQTKIFSGENIINVRQGYTKCSICIVNKNAVITSDAGICKAALNHGIDALLISSGSIELPGMNYGFIGGASGLIAPDILAVNGELKNHPDADKISGFCKNHGVNIIPLKSGAIRDIGSILPYEMVE